MVVAGSTQEQSHNTVGMRINRRHREERRSRRPNVGWVGSVVCGRGVWQCHTQPVRRMGTRMYVTNQSYNHRIVHVRHAWCREELSNRIPYCNVGSGKVNQSCLVWVTNVQRRTG